MRIIAIFLCSLFFASSALAETASLKGFAKFISDAPAEKINGTASGSADLKINGSDITSLQGTISFDVASMKTGNDMRDEHLQGAMWLDAAKYPKITFTIKGITKDDGKYKVAGEFKLHGVAKAITATAKVKTKGNKIKIMTQFEIALADYNVKGKSGVVGDKVGKTIQIQAQLRGTIQ